MTVRSNAAGNLRLRSCRNLLKNFKLFDSPICGSIVRHMD
jgi:hypothetical protein